MAKLRNTLRVTASPTLAWGILGNLGAVDRWVPGVTACMLDGDRRICNEGEIEEEISDYSAESRSYRYMHLKVPLPVKSSRGRLAVEPDDTGSRIVWDAEIEVLEPAGEAATLAMIDGFYKQALESLRSVIEGHAGAGFDEPRIDAQTRRV